MNLTTIQESLESSKQLSATIVILVMLGFTAYDLPQIETNDTYADYDIVEKPYLDTCSLTSLPHLDYTNPDNNVRTIETARNPLNWYLDCIGHKLFNGYNNVLPFLFSVSIIPVTYLLTYSITHKRIAGLVAGGMITLNPLFYDWSSSVTYDQGWALFLLLSIWLVYRAPLLSLPAYLGSILAKGLAIADLPVYLYTVIKSQHSLETKIGICVMLSLVAIVAGAIEWSTIGLIGAK